MRTCFFRVIRFSFITAMAVLAAFYHDALGYTDEEVLQSAIAKGKLAADYWVNRSGVNPSTTNYYADICAFYGACIFGDALDDSTYYRAINNKYNRTQAIKTDNIDNNSCGILPLHLYLHNKKEQQLKLGVDAAKANMLKDGYPRNAIDDTYMTGSLLIQAYRATEDTEYLDFFAEYLTSYMQNLQQGNGLYWHHKELSHQFWGRGNGWGAASSAELLQVIPEDHEKYGAFIEGYRKHMKGLIDAQLNSDMWPQLLLDTGNRNWEETSGTSMFLFAIFTGLELGILDKETYLEPAMKGWMAVAGYLGSDGRLNNIAEGFWPSVGDANEYLSAKKASPGNSHGTAGFLWAATAVVRYYNSITATGSKPGTANTAAVNVASPLSRECFDLLGRSRQFAVGRSISTISPGIIIHTGSGSSHKLTHLP